MAFSDPELIHPLVHCFARCSWCKNLFKLKGDADGEPMIEDSECPHCGAALSEAAILTSFLENIAHTSAIASANKFIALDLAIVPFLLVNLLLAFAEYPLWIRAGNLVCYAGVMVLIGRWFYHYWYRIRYSDPEYLEALSRMKRLLLIWVCGQAIIWGALVAKFFSAS